jgi:hypothetical protein
MKFYKRKHINYRHIYIKHFGEIPKDEFGRRFDIHHIDGDHQNNEPSNLKAVSLQEHYDIHYSLGEYKACQMIAHRMGMSSDKLSEIATLANNQRVQNGTHHLLKKGISHPSYDPSTHTFKNKTTGQIITATQYEMANTYNVHQSNLIEVIRGKRKSVSGWQIVP